MNLVIGVGNPDRGDDGVGHAVAGLLRPYVSVIEHDGDISSLLDRLRAADRVWLVDAAQSGSPAGTIHRIDCTGEALIPCSPMSSHGFGLADAIGLARALDALPRQCVVYAIEAAGFTPGAAMSPAVARAAHEAAARILSELSS